MKLIRELKGFELYMTALLMLTTPPGFSWVYYRPDFKWWVERLKTRVN